jgi:PAS domain S-box-containing protein
MAWVGLVEGDRVRPVAWAGRGVDYARSLDISLSPGEPTGRGPTGTAARTGRSTVCQDIGLDPAMWPWRGAAVGIGHRSSGAFPIAVDGEIAGVLSVYAAEPDFFTPDAVAVLERLVANIGRSWSMERQRDRLTIAKQGRASASRNQATLLDLVRDGVLTCTEEGRVLSANRRAGELLDTPPGDLIGALLPGRLAVAVALQGGGTSTASTDGTGGPNGTGRGDGTGGPNGTGGGEWTGGPIGTGGGDGTGGPNGPGGGGNGSGDGGRAATAFPRVRPAIADDAGGGVVAAGRRLLDLVRARVELTDEAATLSTSEGAVRWVRVSTRTAGAGAVPDAAPSVPDGDERIVMVVLSDDSERRTLRAALRERAVDRERFAAPGTPDEAEAQPVLHALALVPEPAVALDLRGERPRVMAANDHLAVLLGRTIDDLCGPAGRLAHPDDEARERSMFERSLVKREVVSYDTRRLHGDGHWVPVRLTGTVVRRSDGTARFAFATVHDLSSEQAAVHRQQRLDEQLRRRAVADAVLGELARHALGSSLPDDYFERALAAVAGLLGADRACLVHSPGPARGSYVEFCWPLVEGFTARPTWPWCPLGHGLDPAPVSEVHPGAGDQGGPPPERPVEPPSTAEAGARPTGGVEPGLGSASGSTPNPAWPLLAAATSDDDETTTACVHAGLDRALCVHRPDRRPFDAFELEFIESAARLVGLARETDASRSALARSYATLQTLVDAAPASIFLVDGDGRLQLVNAEFERRFGVKRDGAIGHTLDALLTIDTAGASDGRRVASVLRTAAPVRATDVATPADGNTRTYLSVTFPLLDDAGQPYGAGGLSTDISEIAELNAETGRAWQVTVQRLARAVELRDEETGAHVERMAALSELLGTSVGLDRRRTAMLRLAAQMHDAGKVGIPDAILLKPGPLDRAERAVMESHAEIGYRLLTGSGAPLLDMAASIAYAHHERFDGTGYPRRLTGASIPLEARIVAVADVFDALTSDRVYRRALPVDEAVRMMLAERGRHFDPEVLDALVDNLDHARRILDAFREVPTGD